MTLTERIKAAAAQKGETFASLERRLGFSQGSIRKWDRSSPSVDKARALAKCLGVSLVWLIDDEQSDAPPAALDEADGAPTVEMLVYDEPAAAGSGVDRDDWAGSQWMTFPESDVAPNASFGIRIKGDSMEPDIPDGGIVWVKERVWVDSGQIGIFVYENQVYCKKIQTDPKTRKISLVSLNPKYKPIPILDSNELHSVGKVLRRRGDRWV